MVAVGRSQSNLKRRIALWAKGVGLKGNERLMNRFVDSLLIIFGPSGTCAIYLHYM